MNWRSFNRIFSFQEMTRYAAGGTRKPNLISENLTVSMFPPTGRTVYFKSVNKVFKLFIWRLYLIQILESFNCTYRCLILKQRGEANKHRHSQRRDRVGIRSQLIWKKMFGNLEQSNSF